MKIYYLTVIYPNDSVSGPTRLIGVHDVKEVQRLLKQQQKLHPDCKLEITEDNAS